MLRHERFLRFGSSLSFPKLSRLLLAPRSRSEWGLRGSCGSRPQLSTGGGNGIVNHASSTQVCNSFSTDDLGDLNSEIGFTQSLSDGAPGVDQYGGSMQHQPHRPGTPSSTSMHQHDSTLFSWNDLREFNDDIGAFVGPLGDPDFDLEDSPTGALATDDGQHPRSIGHQHVQLGIGDKRATVDVNLSRSGGSNETRRQLETHWTYDKDNTNEDGGNEANATRPRARPSLPDGPNTASANDTPSAPWVQLLSSVDDDLESRFSIYSREDVDGENQPFRSLDSTRRGGRLTLADDPYTATANHTPSIPWAQLSSTVDDLGSSLNRGSSDESQMGSFGGENPISRRQAKPPVGGASVGHNGGGYTKSSSRRMTGRSVLVLNGAACFVRGRLSSTGEPADGIATALKGAADEFGLSLSVFASNRETDLLDRLCGDKYDAIIYNPAGFSASACSSKPATGSAWHCESNENRTIAEPAARVEVSSTLDGVSDDVVDRPQVRDNLLEYGLARARCPVVRIVPRDSHGVHMGDGSAWGVSRCTTRSGEGVLFDEHAGGIGGGRIIAGFSGAVSYRLAMASVAMLLEEQQTQEM